jgi:hypothetical protein
VYLLPVYIYTLILLLYIFIISIALIYTNVIIIDTKSSTKNNKATDYLQRYIRYEFYYKSIKDIVIIIKPAIAILII